MMSTDVQRVLANEATWHVEGCDVREGIAMLPDGCVHVVMTSPPYWALRSYLDAEHADKAKEIGSEPSPEAFIETMVLVFRDIRRVLHPTGTLWVNLGDTYCSTPTTNVNYDTSTLTKAKGGPRKVQIAQEALLRGVAPDRQFGNAKLGDLMNMPHRVAEALCEDGWYWRSTIVWHKRSPMPESVDGWRWVKCRRKVGRKPVNHNGRPKGWQAGEGSHDKVPAGNYLEQDDREATVPVYEDCPGCEKCRPNDGLVLRRGSWRPTTGHEYIFQFAKKPSYFCDAMAVREATSPNSHDRGHGLNPKAAAVDAGDHRNRPKQNAQAAAAINGLVDGRNPRTVWTFSSEPFPEGHFATFPSALPDRILRAATSEKGCCPQCLVPWAPVVETRRVPTRPANPSAKAWKRAGQRSATSPNLDPERHVTTKKVTGWRPCCECNAGASIPMLALDPFAGAGTTILAARRLYLRALGFELNHEFVDMARRRIVSDAPLFNG